MPESYLTHVHQTPIGQVGADLEERRPPVGMLDVEVVVLDVDGLAREVEVDASARGSLLAGAPGWRLGEAQLPRRQDSVNVVLGKPKHRQDLAKAAVAELTRGGQSDLVTALEPSHRSSPRTPAATTLAPMTYTVIYRTTPAGACVHVLLDDEVLQGDDAVRHRLVCQTDDVEQAEQAAALIRERLAAGWTGR